MGETDPSRVLNDFELKAKEFLSAQVKIKGRPRSQVQRDRRWSVGQEFSSLRWKAGFEHYLAVAIQKKNVPLVVVTNRDKAEFEISGGAETEKAGWAKILFMGSAASKEQAGIKIVNLRSDEVVFAYAVHKSNSVRGRQSAAEACAKHMKEKVELK